jgi:hypothetical protein
MLSNQEIGLLQSGQKEEGKKTCPPFFQRKRQTLRKLPTQTPKREEKTRVFNASMNSPQKRSG